VIACLCTCELVLLDVRTGLAPFARILTRNHLELKQSTDLDLAETMRPTVGHLREISAQKIRVGTGIASQLNTCRVV